MAGNNAGLAVPRAPAGAPVVFSPNLNPPMMASRREYPFLIVPQTNPIIVAGSTTLTDTFIVDGETAFSFETIVSTHSGQYRLLLSYGSGSGQLMNRPCHVDLICGNAQRPGFFSNKAWILPIGARTVIEAQFTNLSTTTNTIEIALRGSRIAVYPNMERTQFQGV